MESRIEELESALAASKKDSQRWMTLTQRLYRESMLRLAHQASGTAADPVEITEGGQEEDQDE